jgi:hypothetical protein
MNLSWLDDFLTLAAIGNFSRAADECPNDATGVQVGASWPRGMARCRSLRPRALSDRALKNCHLTCGDITIVCETVH